MLGREARCAKSYFALYKMDFQIAEWFREFGCRKCGGKLDASHYMRKPRGVPHGTPDESFLRFSFCCRVDGCRSRALPPSTRFSGGCVFSAPLLFCFLLVTLCGLILSANRILHQAQVSRRTAARYRQKVATKGRESQHIRLLYSEIRTGRGALAQGGIFSSLIFSKYSQDFKVVTLSAKLAQSLAVSCSI